MGRWTGLGIAAAVLVFAWQTWAIVSLRSDVSDLRGELSAARADDEKRQPDGTGQTTRAASDDSTTPSRATGAARSTKSSAPKRISGDTTPTSEENPTDDPKALDDAVERSLERVEKARFEKKGEQWMQKASTRISKVVDGYVDDGRIGGGQRDDVNDLLLNSLYQTWQLKADVVSGQLDEGEAHARYDASTKEVIANLNDMVGEDTAADLLADVQGGKE